MGAHTIGWPNAERFSKTGVHTDYSLIARRFRPSVHHSTGVTSPRPTAGGCMSRRCWPLLGVVLVLWSLGAVVATRADGPAAWAGDLFPIRPADWNERSRRSSDRTRRLWRDAGRGRAPGRDVAAAGGDGDLKMTTDFRSVYATMIEEWLATTIRRGAEREFRPAPRVRVEAVPADRGTLTPPRRLRADHHRVVGLATRRPAQPAVGRSGRRPGIA